MTGAFDLTSLSKTAILGGCATECSIRHLGETPVLELKASFAQGGAKRAFWDFRISEDMTRTSCIRLRMRGANLAAASQLNIYIKCGNQWYSAKLQPTQEGAWEYLTIPKTSFIPEDQSGSWHKANTLRIAAWYGSPGAISLQVATMEAAAPNAPVCIIRNTSGTAEQRTAALRQAENLGDCLMERGLYPSVIDDTDCSLQTLTSYTLALLPCAENLQASLLNKLLSFQRKGGRFGVFHAMPKELADALQMPTGKFRTCASLGIDLAAVRGTNGGGFRQQSRAFIETAPTSRAQAFAWWMDSSGRQTRYPAILLSSNAFWMTHVFMDQSPADAFNILCGLIDRMAPGSWKTALKTRERQINFCIANSRKKENATLARQLLAKAQSQATANNYTAAMKLFDNAMDALLDGDGQAVPSATANEIRGAWTRNWQGIANGSWSKTSKILEEANINAIFPSMATCWDAAYPSSVLRSRTQRDILKECLASCQGRGIKVHVWLQCMNLENAPDSLRQEMRKKGRLQSNPSGQPIYWLCPANLQNRTLMVSIVSELVSKYPIDGIHLDMLRFQGSQACFCPNCRAAFAKMLGRQPTNWPQSVIDNGEERQKWLVFRQKLITSLLEEMSNAAKKARRGIIVSAAVYPELTNARVAVGQNWKEWQEAGKVDFLCPMTYRSSADMLEKDIETVAKYIPSVCILPGIGLTTSHLSPKELARQIARVRQNKLPGFVLFEFNSVSSENLRIPN